jgi:SOS-response transcriptional repressor LexA
MGQQALADLSQASPPPTLREIREAAHITSAGHLGYHLDILRREGLVSWEPRKKRTIRLTEKGRESLRQQEV